MRGKAHAYTFALAASTLAGLALTAAPAAASPLASAAAAPRQAPSSSDLSHVRARCGGYLDFYGTNVNIREYPRLNARIRGTGNPYDCWAQDYETNGDRAWCPITNTYIDRWSHGYNVRTFVFGFVNWCYLGVPG